MIDVPAKGPGSGAPVVSLVSTTGSPAASGAFTSVALRAKNSAKRVSRKSRSPSVTSAGSSWAASGPGSKASESKKAARTRGSIPIPLRAGVEGRLPGNEFQFQTFPPAPASHRLRRGGSAPGGETASPDRTTARRAASTEWIASLAPRPDPPARPHRRGRLLHRDRGRRTARSRYAAEACPRSRPSRSWRSAARTCSSATCAAAASAPLPGWSRRSGCSRPWPPPAPLVLGPRLGGFWPRLDSAARL